MGIHEVPLTQLRVIRDASYRRGGPNNRGNFTILAKLDKINKKA